MAARTVLLTKNMESVGNGTGMVTFWPFLQFVLIVIVTLGCLVEFAGLPGAKLATWLHPLQSAAGRVVAAGEGSWVAREAGRLAAAASPLATRGRAPACGGQVLAAAGVERDVARPHRCSSG